MFPTSKKSELEQNIYESHFTFVKGCKNSQFKKVNMDDTHLDMKEWRCCDLPCSRPCVFISF